MTNFNLEEIKKDRAQARINFPDGDQLLLSDLDILSKEEIMKVFKKYNFRDEIGCPLINNLHFLELVELAIN